MSSWYSIGIVVVGGAIVGVGIAEKVYPLMAVGLVIAVVGFVIP